jgi:cell division septal protein FtsQ
VPQFVILMAALTAVAAFPQSALFTVDRIDVVGAVAIARDDVVRLAGLRAGERLFAIDARRVAARLEAHPRVRTAVVRLRPPRSAVIAIVERVPVFTLIVDERGVLVDENLKVVAVVTAGGSTTGLPEVVDRSPGAVLTARPGDVVASAGVAAVRAALSDMPAWLGSDLARIVVNVGPDLTLITRTGLTIRAGSPAGLAARLSRLPQVLDALRARGVRAATLDLRYAGSIVVTPATGGDVR